MRVVWDYESLLRDRYSGFFTYGAGLLQGWSAQEDIFELTLWGSRRSYEHRMWLTEAGVEGQHRWAVMGGKARRKQWWWRLLGRPKLERWVGDFDVYHSHHHLMPPTQGRPRVLTVHDLRRYRFPEFYGHSKKGPFERAVREADHITAISQATKDDLGRYLGVDEGKITVVYHGGPVGEMPEAVDEQSWRSMGRELKVERGRYFAVFSSYDRRKNVAGILRAFNRVKGRCRGYKLVIVGQLPADEKVRELMGRAELAEQVVCTGPTRDFGKWLAAARGLVYASFYEGFGLPILEAMAAGTAVLTSKVSSMPEVAGEAALLVDPEDIDAIGEAMVRLAEDDDLCGRLEEAGKERVKAFSWGKTVREMKKVYERVLG